MSWSAWSNASGRSISKPAMAPRSIASISAGNMTGNNSGPNVRPVSNWAEHRPVGNWPHARNRKDHAMLETQPKTIDPRWAWQRYRPSKEARWDLKKVGHLYR